MMLASKLQKRGSLSRLIFRLNDRREMDHASNAAAVATTTPAFWTSPSYRASRFPPIFGEMLSSAKTPFRLGKAKRHRDASALFRLRASGTFGFFRMLLFTGVRFDDGQIRKAVADLSTGNH